MRRRRQVASHEADPGPGALLDHTLLEVADPAPVQVSREGQPDHHRAGFGPHGLDVRDVDRHRFPAGLEGGRPGAFEVDVLDQHIGGDDDVAARHQHCRVVAGAQPHVGAECQAVGEFGDHLELGAHQRNPTGRSRASSMSLVTSSGYGIPDACHRAGYIDIRVNPGMVFTSLIHA